MIAGFLWEPTSNVSNVSIVETALATSYPLRHLASAMCASANDLIPDNFRILFGVSFRATIIYDSVIVAIEPAFCFL
jgi:hypothetical protein